MNNALRASTLHQHAHFLYAMALRQVRDPFLAEDLVQETFLAALGNAGERFRGQSTVRTWLAGILKHKIIDAIRQRRRRMISFDEASYSNVPDASADNVSALQCISRAQGRGVDIEPEATMQSKRFFEACQGHLNLLPRRGAEAFVLTDVLGHDTDEVCQMLGVTPNNLGVMLHRTRRKLRSALADVV